MKEVVCIYNAKGGLLGEISYLCKRVTAQSHCELCEISHGANPLGKKEWKLLSDRFPLPVHTYHLNEADDLACKAAEGNFPVVLLRSGKDYEVLMDASDLKSCRKSPSIFFLKLAKKLNILF